jgi:hypothetical protein
MENGAPDEASAARRREQDEWGPKPKDGSS